MWGSAIWKRRRERPGSVNGQGRREGRQVVLLQQSTKRREAIAEQRLFPEAQVRENAVKSVAGVVEVVQGEAEYDCRKVGTRKMWRWKGAREGDIGKGRERGSGTSNKEGAGERRHRGIRTSAPTHVVTLAQPKFNGVKVAHSA